MDRSNTFFPRNLGRWRPHGQFAVSTKQNRSFSFLIIKALSICLGEEFQLVDSLDRQLAAKRYPVKWLHQKKKKKKGDHESILVHNPRGRQI